MLGFSFLMFQLLSFGSVFCALKSLGPWGSHTCHSMALTVSPYWQTLPHLSSVTFLSQRQTSVPRGLFFFSLQSTVSGHAHNRRCRKTRINRTCEVTGTLPDKLRGTGQPGESPVGDPGCDSKVRQPARPFTCQGSWV